jgi:hypothetical protein
MKTSQSWLDPLGTGWNLSGSTRNRLEPVGTSRIRSDPVGHRKVLQQPNIAMKKKKKEGNTGLVYATPCDGPHPQVTISTWTVHRPTKTFNNNTLLKKKKETNPNNLKQNT